MWCTTHVVILDRCVKLRGTDFMHPVGYRKGKLVLRKVSYIIYLHDATGFDLMLPNAMKLIHHYTCPKETY